MRRLSKAATSGLLVLAVLAVAGTGFAAFTSTAYVNSSATAGTLGPLVWGPAPTNTSLAANDGCNATRGTTNSPGDTLFLNASGLMPGDLCSYGDSLWNGGTLPATASEQITSASGGLCAVISFGDSFFKPSVVVGTGGQISTVPHTIHAESWIQWAGFISLSPSAGSSYGDESCSFVVTLTGTAGT